jgi:hypothetical protein
MGGVSGVGCSADACVIQSAPLDYGTMVRKGALVLGLKPEQLVEFAAGKPKQDENGTVNLTALGRDKLIGYLEDYHQAGTSRTGNAAVDDLVELLMDDPAIGDTLIQLESEIGAGPKAKK